MVGKHRAKRLVLFDAHAIIHRAYHALPDFSTKKGEPTGGLYGLATMLMRSIQEFDPDYMAACYDLPKPTFRHKEYKDYKAGRKKADEELKLQLARSRDIFAAFHIPIYDKEGFEADDMLGTIVAQTKRKKDLEILIVTGDMDSLQLVEGDRVRVYTLRKGINDTVVYNEAKVRERFGFGPELLPDYKGLRGDPSDNIVGVPGIGEKTGGELIQKFGTIEAIEKTLKKDPDTLLQAGVKPRVIELLRSHKEDALFSKMLATIRRDAPIEYKLPSAPWRSEFTPDAALALFDELEFRSLAARIRTLAPSGAEKNASGHTSEDAVEPKSQRGQKTTLFSEEVDPSDLKKTAIALWLLDSEKTSAGVEEIVEYGGGEGYEKAKARIFADLEKEGLTTLYRDIELPIIPIIEKAEARGIAVDVPYLKTLSEKYHKEIAAIESRIYEHAGEVFNINSPKQLGGILFDTMGLTAKGLKKTEGGARSTRESELEKLRGAHPIIGDILAYREIQKLLSTYIDNIPAMVGADGRLHTTLNQNGTTTGRFSSTNPNLQNIPVREGHGSAIRNAFVAGKGNTLLALDYSQVEMRVLAMLSKDPGLVEIFRSGEDIHTSVAARVFRVSQEEVTKEMRRRAKTINFGIIYGMGVNSLKDALGSSRDEAQAFYDQYFVAFPKIAEYFDAVIARAKKLGYTETIFGRRRHFPDLRSRIPYMRAMAERMAMNAPLQGSAADFVKIAMKRADDAILKEGLADEVGLLLQVHDELIYEVRDDARVISRAADVIGKAMESSASGTTGESVPLVVDRSTGTRWGSLEPLNSKAKK